MAACGARAAARENAAYRRADARWAIDAAEIRRQAAGLVALAHDWALGSRREA